MGLISFIVNNKQLCELEEVIPILWDKINSFYMTKIRSSRFNYTDTPMGNLNLRNKYGNGKIIKPQNDLPDYLQAKMREFMKEEGLADGGEMFVIKSSDYNYFMMSLAEFSKKSNCYIQLMKKSSLQLSTNMNNIFRAYQNVVENINHKYIYVVE